MCSLNFSNASNLPIFGNKTKIINMVRENQVIVIYGNTGSGKTTQIPQYLLEAELNSNLCIAITQPWNIAVISMAKRVANEVGCVCGKEVGYEVTNDNQSSTETKIKYMTDDFLLNLCIKDNMLSEYGIIMIDEAHERTIYTDVVLGILKDLITKRTDLKILITSAFCEIEKFSLFFNQAPVLRLQNNKYQVVPIYEPIKRNDFITRSVNIVEKTLKNGNEGDYLIFLPSENQIEECCERLCGIDNISVFKLYESMNYQDHLFADIPHNYRRVIVANNIAETMFTISSVRYVIDCGLVMERNYRHQLGTDVCKEKKISQARADMRAQRAGCQNKGWCYRIYRTKVYDNLDDETVPEILRKDFSELYMKLMNLGFDPATFDLIDRPPQKMLQKCHQQAQDFNLLDNSNCLTETGRNIRDIPLDIVASKVLLSSSLSNNSTDIASIMAMMSANVFERTPSHNFLLDTCHRAFYDEDGDHFTRLNVYNSFSMTKERKKWCYLNYLNYDALIQAEKLRNKLVKIMECITSTTKSISSESNKGEIKASIIKEYYRNICIKKTASAYINYLSRRVLYMDPYSCLYEESPDLILYHECIHNVHKPIIYGILKIDETLLKDFPSEMKIINYQPGEISECTSTYHGRVDPFGGDNDPVFVYESEEDMYF